MGLPSADWPSSDRPAAWNGLFAAAIVPQPDRLGSGESVGRGLGAGSETGTGFGGLGVTTGCVMGGATAAVGGTVGACWGSPGSAARAFCASAAVAGIAASMPRPGTADVAAAVASEAQLGIAAGLNALSGFV